ncbi:MAG: polysaccharide deacetylase family protein [Deltaproteobacteria bacterium]|nr:polysaccharide deacetylase family protein [Deltaproteobacteria bacterium]
MVTYGFPLRFPSLNRVSYIFSPLILFILITGCAATSRDIIKDGATLHESTDRVKMSENYAVVLANPSDTYESLAEKYLRDKNLAYIIAEFNKNKNITADQPIVIPLKPVNPGGIMPEGYQTVPVLCYHQFSSKKSRTKIAVSAEMFDGHMAYLKDNGYHVITLSTLRDFIEYKQRPPKNSVVITIDDGWKTMKTIAFPILKKYGFKASLFVYTDLIRSEPNNVTLTWDEIKEMVDEGIIDVQSHTITHGDLTKLSEESLERELAESQRIIKEHLGINATFIAYPYGTIDERVMEKLKKYGYVAGFTVIRGGNAFYHHNYALNRTMIFSNHSIDDFAELVGTFKKQ